jgi:hypothetical protein
MAALLSERQKTAERLTRELHALGATVTSVPPLRDDARLRFWVTDAVRPKVLMELAEGNWPVIFCGCASQFTIRDYDVKLVSIFEIDLPAERQPVVDDRIRGEIARPEKTSVELEGLRKYLEGPPKKQKRRWET